MFEVFVSLYGRMVCAFGLGLARITGNYEDAVGLCMFIKAMDL